MHAQNSKPRYIIIVVADSLRPDHMGCYGYDKITTPSIDEKSKDALIFKNAFTTGDWTRPAVSSLFTGLYVFQHKVIRFELEKGSEDNEDSFEKQTMICDIVSENAVTLAESLKERGFKTLGLNNSFSIDKMFGFARGFDKYIRTTEDEFIKIFQTFFKDNKTDQLFCYIHFDSPHKPYRLPPFDCRAQEIAGQFESLNEAKIRDYPYDKIIPADCAKESGLDIYKNIGECMLDYDKKIFWVDRQFKKLWDFLEQEGALEDSLLVFLADHGEGFGEHGGMAHGNGLHEETIHIPLIIWNFKYMNSGQIDRVVSVIDLYPTILSSLNCSADHLNREFKYYGRSLLEADKIPEDRGIIVEMPNILYPQEGFTHLGVIIYRTGDKKIYLDNSEKNVSFYKIIDGYEILCQDDSEFKEEKEAFATILEKIKSAYLEYEKTMSHKEKVAQKEVEKLRALGYLQ
jgi:arylsulfatase A-like enzyme